ncbi:hypothetical protein VNO77_20131 [Canavalia gladiata]|uniref:Uncharacterized protein n=1 Tax=Canavalia gladiata TaxID=3824 RepID=A0AAN9LPL3_CANGL
MKKKESLYRMKVALDKTEESFNISKKSLEQGKHTVATPLSLSHQGVCMVLLSSNQAGLEPLSRARVCIALSMASHHLPPYPLNNNITCELFQHAPPSPRALHLLQLLLEPPDPTGLSASDSTFQHNMGTTVSGGGYFPEENSALLWLSPNNSTYDS